MERFKPSLPASISRIVLHASYFAHRYCCFLKLVDCVNVKIKTGKQALSHRLSRICLIDQWKPVQDPVSSLIRSEKIVKKSKKKWDPRGPRLTPTFTKTERALWLNGHGRRDEIAPSQHHPPVFSRAASGSCGIATAPAPTRRARGCRGDRIATRWAGRPRMRRKAP